MLFRSTNQFSSSSSAVPNAPEHSSEEDLSNKQTKTQSQPTGRRSVRGAGLTSSPNTTDLSSFARVILMLSLIAWYMLQGKERLAREISSCSEKVAATSPNALRLVLF